MKSKRPIKLALFGIGISLILIATKNSLAGKIFAILGIVIFAIMIISYFKLQSGAKDK